MQLESGAGRELDDEVRLIRAVELLGAGRPHEAVLAVEDRPPEDPVVPIVLVDAAVRRHESGPADVERVARLVSDAVGRDRRLGWWLQAIVADRLLQDGDFEGVALVAGVLAGIPTSPSVDTLTRYVRGRLRRGLGLALAANPVNTGDGAPGADLGGHRALWAGAVDDFGACGFWAEVAVSRALHAGVRALLCWENPPANLQRLVDVRDELSGACDPEWIIWVDFLIGLVAIQVGDADRVREAGRVLAGRLPTTSPYLPLGPYFDAVGGLLGDREDPDELVIVIDRCIALLGDVVPRLVPLLQMHVANALGDRGHPDAIRFGVSALDVPRSRETGRIHSALLARRLDAVRGRLGPSEEVTDLLRRLEGHGQGRIAAAKALRLAQDYRRLGAAADAEALRAWGLAHLDSDQERAFWDRRWSSWSAVGTTGPRWPLSGPSGPSDPPPAGMALRVLAPELELRRGDRRVAVDHPVARLLLVMVLAHPSPVHVGPVAEQLRPGVPADEARRRLDGALGRLRGLFPGGEVSVRRRGDVISFEPVRLAVDLLSYREALGGGPAGQAAALAGLRGNLCHEQFPGDEALARHRSELASQWSRLARQLLASGDLAPGDLALVLDVPGLADALGLPGPD